MEPRVRLKSLKDTKIQREFLDALATKLGVKRPSDWGVISKSKILAHGGSSVLRFYNNSIIKTLKSVYPDINWQRTWFQQIPVHFSGYWNDRDVQKTFFRSLEDKLGIKEPKDWGNIKVTQVIELGGQQILSKYGGSLIRALKNIFQEIDWKKEWFARARGIPAGFWFNKKNQRKFFENLAKKLSIHSPQDWGKVHYKTLVENKAASVLRFHKGSLRLTLASIYPDVEWKKEWFRASEHSKGWWKDPKNQRKFLDELAKHCGIKTPSEWGKITLLRLRDNGGRTLLNHYGGSLALALKKVYPETQWRQEWFVNIPKYDPAYFITLENQRKFLDDIASQYVIKSSVEWKRVTSALIKKHGGNGLLRRYGNSLAIALHSVYGENILLRLQPVIHVRSREEDVLKELVKSYFPYYEISMNFRHPGLISETSGKTIELDIYIPRLNLAFEYHGAHHFRETYNQQMMKQKSRDASRREQCKKAGITLIEVPYWWLDASTDEKTRQVSLLTTIVHERPDLIPVITTPLKEDVHLWSRITNNAIKLH